MSDKGTETRSAEERIAEALERIAAALEPTAAPGFLDETQTEKRERFAGVAMEGLLAGSHRSEDGERVDYETEADLAEEAVRYADALLAALDAQEGK